VSVMNKINEQSILDGSLSPQDVIDLLNNRDELYSIIQDMKSELLTAESGLSDEEVIRGLYHILNNNVKLVSTNGEGMYYV